MKNDKKLHKIALAGLAVASVLAGIAACSSDDNGGNPTPPEDAGNPADSTTSSSSSGSSSGSGSGSGSGSSSGSVDGGSGGGDSSCVADATPNCSSCASLGNNPYNACSAFTVNCVPFDNSVLPSPYPTF